MIHTIRLLGVLLVLLFFSHASAGHVSNINSKTIKLPPNILQSIHITSNKPSNKPAPSIKTEHTQETINPRQTKNKPIAHITLNDPAHPVAIKSPLTIPQSTHIASNKPSKKPTPSIKTEHTQEITDPSQTKNKPTKYIIFKEKVILNYLTTEQQYLDLLSDRHINGGILSTTVYSNSAKSSTLSLDMWLLCEAIKDKDSIIIKHPRLQAQFVKLIIEDRISAAVFNSTFKNESVFYHLLTSEGGSTIIASNPALQAKIAELIIENKISSATLNQLTLRNDSVFYWLLASEAGNAIITANPALQIKLAKLIISNKISSATLNQLTLRNDSVFYWLLASEAGNAIITANEVDLYQIPKKLEKQKIIELLKNNPNTAYAVFENVIYVIKNGVLIEFMGNYWLECVMKSLKANNQNPVRLTDKQKKIIASNTGYTPNTALQNKFAELITDDKTIFATALFQLTENNYSVFYLLLTNPAIRTIITTNYTLQAILAQLIIKLITEDVVAATALLNALTPHHGSVFYQLLASPVGSAIITASSELQTKLADLITNGTISIATLTQMTPCNNPALIQITSRNASAFYHLLTSPAGNAIITASSELQTKLADLIINDEIPMTILFGFNSQFLPLWLCTAIGKQMCENNPRLKSKINALISKHENKILTTNSKTQFNLNLEYNFPNLDTIVYYIHKSLTEKDKTTTEKSDSIIDQIEAKLGYPLKKCNITHNSIVLPVVVTLADGKQIIYELTELINYIEQLKDTRTNESIIEDKNILTYVIYENIRQNFRLDLTASNLISQKTNNNLKNTQINQKDESNLEAVNLDQAVNIYKYKIPAPNTQLYIKTIAFDSQYVWQIYKATRDLSATAKKEWVDDQIKELTKRRDHLNKEIEQDLQPSLNLEIELAELNVRLRQLIAQKKDIKEHFEKKERELAEYKCVQRIYTLTRNSLNDAAYREKLEQLSAAFKNLVK